MIAKIGDDDDDDTKNDDQRPAAFMERRFHETSSSIPGDAISSHDNYHRSTKTVE